MICYKDICFCSAYKTCADGDHCFRALTETVKAEAEIGGYLIRKYSDYPECFKGTIEIFDANNMNGQTSQEDV